MSGFFDNHGLLNLVDRPQWYTITAGPSHIPKITARFADRIHLSSPVRNIVRESAGIRMMTDADEAMFDHVVLAYMPTRPWQFWDALYRCGNPGLGNLPFIDNQVVLHHGTPAFCRTPPKAWPAGTITCLRITPTGPSTLTYNMNIPRQLDLPDTCLVTPEPDIDAHNVLAALHLCPPGLSSATVTPSSSGTASPDPGSAFLRAYWFNGFHEDGVKSALRVCEALGVTP